MSKIDRVEMMPTSYVVLDLETTGTNHFKDEIIEIGAIKYHNGREIERLSLLVKTDKKIPSKVIEITGITNEMLRGEGVDKSYAIMSLYNFLGDYIVIGHNIASFDSKFINDAYQECLNSSFLNDYVDTLQIARKECPYLEHHKLADLAELFNIDYSKAHRAIEDCIINHLVYEKMVFGKVLCESAYSGYFLKNVVVQPSTIDVEIDEMVEIDDTQYVGWKKLLSEVLEEIILDENLPPKALNLKANFNRERDKITSYSLCIYEPDLVEDKRSADRYNVISRIIEKNLQLSIEPKNQEELSKLELPKGAEVHSPNKAPAYFKINQNSESLITYWKSSVKYALANYVSKAESFACCARYEECSNAKKCLHPNQLYSTACAYRKNLESGKIFYGENKNIE